MHGVGAASLLKTILCVIQGQQQQKQQLPYIAYPTTSQAAGMWPPAPGMARPTPPPLPQHMMQRNVNQPPIGPHSHLRAPGNQPGAFPAFHQQHSLGSHLGQQQQQPRDLQAQLQQALDNQARQSAEHQRNQQQQLQRQSIDQAQSNYEPADPQSRIAGGNTFSTGFDSSVWPGGELSPNAARRAEQHRQLAEMLAGSSLHQHDSGLSQHGNSVLYGGSQASQDQMHRLTSLAGASSYDQVHRLTSLGAVSSPEQPFRLTSMGGVNAHEHAYRLSSLGTATSSDAMAALRDGGSHMRQYPGTPIPEDAGLQQGSHLGEVHDWGRQL